MGLQFREQFEGPGGWVAHIITKRNRENWRGVTAETFKGERPRDLPHKIVPFHSTLALAAALQ